MTMAAARAAQTLREVRNSDAPLHHCTIAPRHQIPESHHHCLTASLLQPRLQKVDH